MIVCNFTPDKVRWMHVGQAGALKPGDIVEFEDKRAKHILNQWGPRGILHYKLTDDPEAKKKEAMEIWKRFWMHQIATFNQQNEARKNEGNPYNFPTEDLTSHAEALGVELIGPWKSTPKTENAEVNALKAENAELKEQVTDLKKDMAEMLNIMRELKEKPNVPIVIDTAELVQKFISLDARRYKTWVLENSEEIATWPKQVIDKAKEKWNAFYKDMDWPLP